ncbi:MAG: hypothetical protein ORN98_01630 [Alphaproteobacteria bacterium]|nr:hypothetical protein [Alphaproteobacteria bacterium]
MGFYPIMCDLDKMPVILVGRGPEATRRLRLLDEAGAKSVTVYSDAPSADFAAAAGERLRHGLPTADTLPPRGIMLIGDLEAELGHQLAEMAHQGGLWVNVEDQIADCDFYSAAMVRRGDLLITVSTGGKIPGLSGEIAAFLGKIFTSEWRDHLQNWAVLRKNWRDMGQSKTEIRAKISALLQRTLWHRRWQKPVRIYFPMLSPLAANMPLKRSVSAIKALRIPYSSDE